MSVIIKGMEMPQVCLKKDGYAGSCPMERVWCAQRYAPSGYTMGEIYADMTEKIPSWCPLGELPTPHGRMIDADRLIKVMIETLKALRKNPKMDNQEAHLLAAFHTVGDMVNDAPTVIEAEE